MKAFWINPEGKVMFMPDCPEEHFSKGCHTELHCESESLAFSEVYCGCYNRYSQELQAAKDSAIECTDQERWLDYLWQIASNKWKDSIHPFPKEYTVEVVIIGSADGSEKVAVIIPKEIG